MYVNMYVCMYVYVYMYVLCIIFKQWNYTVDVLESFTDVVQLHVFIGL